MPEKILIIGTNDIASACALRLFRSAFNITMISPDIPLDLYHYRNFSNVQVSGSKMIDNVTARTLADFLYKQKDRQDISLENFVKMIKTGE